MTVRVLYAVLGIASGVLSIVGFVLWMLKRRKRATPRVRAARAESSSETEEAVVTELSVS
jgi:uncharacterized iron-regulated membrane protein